MSVDSFAVFSVSGALEKNSDGLAVVPGFMVYPLNKLINNSRNDSQKYNKQFGERGKGLLSFILLGGTFFSDSGQSKTIFSFAVSPNNAPLNVLSSTGVFGRTLTGIGISIMCRGEYENIVFSMCHWSLVSRRYPYFWILG